MRKLLFAALLCLSCASTAVMGAPDERDNQSPVVVLELFTSEGCSSCPPADRLLSEIAHKHPDSVALLSEHVDYWNYIGWRDPNSSSQFTERQKTYSSRFSLNSLYTPQLVVDGRAQGVGRDYWVVSKLLNEAFKAPLSRLKVVVSEEGAPNKLGVRVNFGTESPTNAEVHIAITEDDVISHVTSGENSGAQLRHDGLTRLFYTGKLPAAPKQTVDFHYNLQPSWKREHLNVIAFVQEAGAGKILAAGKTRVVRAARN